MTKKPNLDDEVFYERVIEELRRGEKREGLWAKALTEALNDAGIAQSLYMKWRVAQLVDEAHRDAARKHGDTEATIQMSATAGDKRFPVGPVVLWALAAWFTWDVITGAEAYQKYPAFNLGGMALFAIAATISTYRFMRHDDSETLPPNRAIKPDVE
jgi:hypothetical protein